MGVGNVGRGRNRRKRRSEKKYPMDMASSGVELASSDDQWEVSAEGVSYYEIGFPNVLRPPPRTGACRSGNGITSFHAYLMCYTVEEEGEDALLLEGISNPTRFLLLSPSCLDEDVMENLRIRLNLPRKECVSVSFTSCGVIHLDHDQIIIVKAFNTFVFTLIMGKSFVESSKQIAIVENKVKGYYVMPVVDGRNDSIPIHHGSKTTTRSIDWKTAINLVKCKLEIMKKGPVYCQRILNTQSMPATCNEDNTTLSNTSLILKSGCYDEEELIDAYVTYGPWNIPCFIIGISKDRNGLSTMEGNDECSSYSEYWLKRYKFELKHASQPLLVCYTLSHVANFLQKSSQAHWCNAKSKRIKLPPEVCILYKGLKGCLWRGAFRLPSILCGLENALLAAELRDSIHLQTSAFKIQEALTAGAYNMPYSYERLELIGDSFLTLSCATMLYVRDASMNKEDMASSLHRIVENKELFRCAKECGLASYIFNQPFLVREWIPPGPIPDCLKSNEKRLQLGLVRKQRISWRTLADVVEAIVGIFTLQSNNMNEALKAISWLRIGIDYLEFDITRVLITPSASLSPCVINHLETGIGYHFKNVGLASMALHYDAQDPDGGLHFSRLAYLGDCILSHQVAKHLLTSYQTEKVGVINDMKQSIINKENLAFVCVKHVKLHMVLSGILGEVEDSIVAYVAAIEKIIKDRKPPSFGYAVSCAPKVLGDIFSAITAAIYLDSELDIEIVWKIVQPLLEPLPKPGLYSLHPINELQEICKGRGMFLDIQSTSECESRFYETRVIIDKQTLASFRHKDRRTSRKFAAFKALEALKPIDEQ